MKNLMEDPDVMRLYRDLQNKRFSDVNDYLTSSPVDEINNPININNKAANKFDRKIFIDGVEMQDFEGDNEYGL